MSNSPRPVSVWWQASLMPLAQEARKPMFALKPADGALAGHVNAVADCRRDFRRLARVIVQRAELPFADGTALNRPGLAGRRF